MAILTNIEIKMIKECVENNPNDVSKMIEIGEILFNNHKEIYTDKMISTLHTLIGRYCSENMSAEEKNEILYRSIYDYWVYGNSCDEEFYYDFLNKTHEEKSEYITFRIREKYCAHLNEKGNLDDFVDKYKSYKKFQKYYLRDVMQITSDDDYNEFEAFVKKHPTFVVKPKDMAFGIGVYLVKESDYSDIKELFNSVRTNGKKVADETVWAKNDSIVIEELIDQDPIMAAFHPESANGVRVTTVRVGEEVTLYYPWFKVGANHNFVTSAVFGTLDAGIDPNTGKILTCGFKENGETYDNHPNTGLAIKGFTIPKWDELVKIAKEVAMSLDGVNYVGWDFVLTPKGWCIMEANYDGDFMGQLFYEKGIKREFEELINWKPNTNYWWEM